MILAIVNQKGGVGKTTTAVTLAHGLAIEGHRVLIVDLDSQGQVASCLGLPKLPGLYHLLAKGAGAQAVTDTGRPRLRAVLSDKNTVSAQQEVSAQRFREHALDRALASIKDDYDTIILDTAPGADLLQINALLACTHLMIPVKLDHLSVQGASDTLATVSSLEKLGALKARFLGVLPTYWEQTTTHTQDQLKVLVKQFGNLVWPPIPADTKVREASAEGLTLWEYAPVCRALSGALVNGGMVGGYKATVERLMETIP